MKIRNVIRALEKEGFKVEITETVKGKDESGEEWFRKTYFCKNDRNKCEWFETKYREGEIDSIKVQGINQNDDMMTDYFPGIWCRTIKNLIKNMKY